VGEIIFPSGPGTPCSTHSPVKLAVQPPESSIKEIRSADRILHLVCLLPNLHHSAILADFPNVAGLCVKPVRAVFACFILPAITWNAGVRPGA
jgi:hypothetical protein